MNTVLKLTTLFLFLSHLTLQAQDALKIEENGNVTITENLNAKNVNVTGKVKENGNDLLPSGAIIIWYGDAANVPNGWAICDGKKYKTSDNKVIETPDLRDRFIVGAGNNYKKDDKGGTPKVDIKEENLPPHTHKIESAGEHSHNFHRYDPEKSPSSNTHRVYLDFNGNATTGFQSYGNNGTSASGIHTHEIKKETNKVVEKIEILPPYYALYYIMKL